MRLGTSSYIIPADILPNVEFLGPLVDIELVLFETDEYGSNLPDAATVARLNELAAEHDLTYTVHLPLDLRLADDGSEADVSIVKARKVLACTADLNPFAYIVHLNGQALLGDYDATTLAGWQSTARRSLETLFPAVSDPRLLCVENLERWSPDAFAPLVDELPISRCVDIGHLWLMGEDPLPRLTDWLPRTRVCHLHGIGTRDHQSLGLVSPERLKPVVDELTAHFDGVATFEVFSEADLRGSLEAWRSAAAN